VKACTDENPRVELAVARGMAACEDVEEVRRIVNIAQAMINLAINQLDTLRTRCAVTEEVTQQQIRKLEVRGSSKSGHIARENQD